ncbi:hypothetical protein [Jiangella rhizosphaerae]|uniref:hypothetical protein n=1 Tax=Jiangella rhizosphaerae TaxID=2293569 RepID=UPI0011C3C675|nr:hypothetical protein [Jiangella rhizosphaerae]
MDADVPDPLLRLPDEQIAAAPGLSGDDLLEDVFTQVYDHVNLHAMAWPAADRDGNLVPPPGAHVLHDLAHVHDLAGEEDLMVNPRLGTVAVVPDLPECDFCYLPARYDARITIGERRVGANLCGDHYRVKGSGTLGASGDAYLMLRSEVPESVRLACNKIRAAQSEDPLF